MASRLGREHICMYKSTQVRTLKGHRWVGTCVHREALSTHADTASLGLQVEAKDQPSLPINPKFSGLALAKGRAVNWGLSGSHDCLQPL